MIDPKYKAQVDLLLQTLPYVAKETIFALKGATVNSFYDGAEYYVWHNMRLLAVDGTRLVLPNHPTVAEEFGVHQFGPKADSPRSLAMGSLLYDVLNLTTIDSQIAPYASSERDLLMQHLDQVKPGDLLLLDRGCPSFWLLFLMKAKGLEFCVRLKDDWWLKVKDFTESPDKERIATFSLPVERGRGLQITEKPHRIGRFFGQNSTGSKTRFPCKSILDDPVCSICTSH